MATYRFHTSLGIDTVDSGSDLLALRMARFITGRADLMTIERWNGERWVHTHVTQMLYGQNARDNLKATYGSTAARFFKKAQREFELSGHEWAINDDNGVTYCIRCKRPRWRSGQCN